MTDSGYTAATADAPDYRYAIAYGVVAVIVAIVLGLLVMKDRSPMYGPQEEEEDFVIVICIAALWIVALVVLLFVWIFKLLDRPLPNDQDIEQENDCMG